MNRLRISFRVLPSVAVACLAALAFRGADLVMAAGAEGMAASGKPAAAGPDVAALQDVRSPSPQLPAELGGTTASPAEADVLSSLAERRDALDARDHELELRANLIAAAEQRVDAKIAELKSIEGRIASLLGQRTKEEEAQIEALVRVYSAMKPKDAARIFATLERDVLLSVAARMKPDAMAGILANMPGEAAQELTVALATRLKLPEPSGTTE